MADPENREIFLHPPSPSGTTGTLSADTTHNTMGMASADVLAFAKVLDDIFELPPGHKVRKALEEEGFERISDLVGLSHSELEELPFSPVFVRRFKKLVDW